MGHTLVKSDGTCHCGRRGCLDAEVRLERLLDLLAVAFTDFVKIFNPEVILLGGFLGTIYALYPERLKNAVAAAALGGLGAKVRIERALLGAELLLVGAAELAFAQLLADPAGR